MTKAKEKRKQIIEALLSNGYQANEAYLANWRPDYIMDPRTGETTLGENYLIHKDGSTAITVKKSVLTVHQESRGFCKGISMQLNHIEMTPQGLKSGKILLLY
ncbi:hypothetical protein ACFYKX_10735 [Cytobacillus sp. FJAT-54145]|uniref:Uncharacterized protein n=1 Tax=Cytobacillus spartinae TaxID=3299023 RepID=A0ABW6KDV0_9BACI